MPRGASRASSLKPEHFLEFIEEMIREGKIKDKVFARRLVSALFFALFNYWAAKQWDSGARGKGPRQDHFPYTLFVKNMLDKGLDRSIIFIYLHRTMADHYVLNPTVVRIWEKELPIPEERVPVSLKPRDLTVALKAAKELLKTMV